MEVSRLDIDCHGNDWIVFGRVIVYTTCQTLQWLFQILFKGNYPSWFFLNPEFQCTIENIPSEHSTSFTFSSFRCFATSSFLLKMLTSWLFLWESQSLFFKTTKKNDVYASFNWDVEKTIKIVLKLDQRDQLSVIQFGNRNNSRLHCFIVFTLVETAWTFSMLHSCMQANFL